MAVVLSNFDVFCLRLCHNGEPPRKGKDLRDALFIGVAFSSDIL